MTEQEYKNKLNELEDLHTKNKNTLARDYAISNNPFKVGDIVTDHIGSLKIEKITWSHTFLGLPSCVYYGIELKKDGKPAAKQKGRSVYQSNLINPSI